MSIDSFSQTMPASGVATGASSGTWTVPANVYSIKIDAWGGGGAGAGRSTTGTGGMAGGAGGSRSTTTISVTPGQTIYYSIGAARAGTTGNAADGNDTWVSEVSNAAPTVSTDGVVSKGGKSAVGTTAGTGSTTGCVGTSSRGGSGRLGGVTSGGGGSSAGTTLDGTDATGRAGATAPTGGGNGGGGHASGGNGTAGSSPGGGGGGAYKNNTTGRSGGGGAAGRVILTYQAIPVCATPTSPTNGATNTSTSQTLSWGAVSGATSYGVYFGTTSTPTFIQNQAGTTYNPGTLLSTTTYYWKVIPKNAAGDALSCSTWSFTTKAPGCLNASYGLYPSTTYTPACVGTVENITTTGYAGEYSNVSLTNGVSYTFSSSNATDYITISNSAGTTVLTFGTTPVVWTSTLTGTVRFYTHTNDACTEAMVSRTRRIQCSIAPDCSTPSSPTDGATSQSIGPSLNWNSVASASSYDVYFGTSSTPPFIVNQTGTSYTPATLSYNTTYYWKIVPKNGAGSAVGCSTWSFSTGGPGCLNAPYGQFPSTTYNPNCSGTAENITTSGYAGEYSVVNLISNVAYTMSSSVATDFITITDATGSTILAYGTASLTYTPSTDGDFRFYTHTNESCGTTATGRARRIQCTTPPPPANDLVANAIDVGICGGAFTGNTKFATQTGDAPSCYTGSFETWTAPGVWYKVVGNGQNITASLCGSTFDTKIFIYTGTAGSLTCLTYNDDFCSTQSQVTFSSTLNTTYHILVTGYGSAKGGFTLNVSLVASPPVISTQPTSGAVCSGQSRTFSVVASGNQGPLSYQWYLGGVAISGATSSSYVASAAGTYYVIVSNSCSSTTQSSNATLTVNSLPTITVSSPEICNGFSTQVTAGGGISYLWSTGATTSTISVSPSVTTNYTVTGTDANGCQSQATSTVTVNANPLVSLNTTSSTICAGGSGTNNIVATASSGTPTYTYQWQYWNGSSWLNTGTNTNTLNATPTVTREYRVIVSDVKGCQVTSPTHTVTVVPDPINPTLNTKTPNQTDVCAGTNLSATFNSGSGGVSCGDVYQFSTNGTTWSSYTPGNNISTSSISQGATVQIRGRRTNCAAGIGCSANGWDVLATWSIVTPPSLSNSVTNVSCNGLSNGSINLTVSGSTPPYTYNWTGPNGFSASTEDISGLSVGSYTINVSVPSGCISSSTIVVSQPPVLQSSFTKTDINCFGNSTGSINLSPSGGTAPYSFSWSNGSMTEDISTLPVGNYSVTITDLNGCQTTNSVTLTEPTLIISSISSTNANCAGSADGTVTIDASGGTGTLTYYWSNGSTNQNLTGLSSGGYTVTITDANSCTTTNSVNITQPGPLTSTVSVSNPSCFGQPSGMINLAPIGGTAPYSYSWSNGATTQSIGSLSPGTYSVTLTDSKGCTTTNSATITQPTQLTTTVTSTNVNCYGDNNGSASVSVSGGTPPYIYSWSGGGNQSSKSNLTAGNYQLTVMDNKGCTKIHNINISQPNQLSISLSIFSYPTCGSSGGQINSTILGGTSPYTYLWSNGQTTQNLTNVTSGNYTLTVTDSKGCQITSSLNLGCSTSNVVVGEILGPVSVCNTTTATYQISYSNGTPTSINWILPNGITSNNGISSSTINVNILSSFVQDSIKVDLVANGQTYRRNIWITKLPYTPQISGSFCGEPVGSIKTYIVTNSQSNTTYNWTPPYGGNIYTGQGNDTVQLKSSSFLVSGSVGSVTATNSCGSNSKQFTLDRLVVRPTAIIGPTSVCADGSTVYTYRVDSVPTSFAYIWNVANGVTIIGSSNNDTLKVRFSTNFTSGQFSVMSINKCGSSPMTYGTVSNNNLYANIGTISGPGDLCPYLGQTTTYSVSPQSGTFFWSTPTGLTIVSGQGTNVVTVSVMNSFTSGNISVSLNNGCGGSISSSKSLSTTTTAISASSITGPRSVCSLIGTSTTATYSISPINGVNYNWSVPANSTIVSGQGTSSINVTFQNGFTGGNIQLVITGSCGNPVTRIFSVGTGLPSISISGVSCVDNGYTNSYSVSTTGALSFNWTVPGNAQIVRGQGTSSIDVFFPSNFETTSCINNACDSIKLITQFACGSVKSTRRIGLLTVRPTVTGINQACFPDTIRLTTSTSPRNTSYIWNSPNGVQFIGSTTGNTVMAKTTSSFMGGTFSVMGVNTCGSSPMAYFGVNKVCPIPSTFSNNINSTNKINNLDFIEESKNDIDFIAFPNPGKNIIQLRVYKGNSEYYLVKITNMLGQLKYSGLKQSEDSMNLSELQSGIYFITIEEPSGNRLTKEIIITE